MVFEYADGGTLFKHLQTYFPKLTWNDKHKLALGISDGLLYLHKLDIVHKDLVCVDTQLFMLVKYIMSYTSIITHLILITILLTVISIGISHQQTFFSKKAFQR